MTPIELSIQKDRERIIRELEEERIFWPIDPTELWFNDGVDVAIRIVRGEA